MTYPQIPPNEEERIKSLKSYQILNSLPEEDYDSITQIAALICNKPIALINFIDSDWTFLKSTHGANLENAPRKLSFCSSAINNPHELLIVRDSRTDSRFADHPYVKNKPHVIFYAGMPLVNKEGLALGAICVIDDKPGDLNDEQKAALKGLSKQVMNLMELRKRNILLEEYQQKLELRSIEMENFAYLASHDLKEPLRMIKSFMQLLKKNYAHKLDEKANKYIDFAVDGAERMNIFIKDLLAYANTGSEEVLKEKVDTQLLVTEIASLQKAVLNEKGAKLIYENLPTITVYKTPLSLVLNNLITNALKYQAPGAKPEIIITIEEKTDHYLFAVKDNGIGIEEQYLLKIFDLFKRLHVNGEYSGTGMGLATCKKIVQQHGGTIWATSKLGEGSTFYFTFTKGII